MMVKDVYDFYISDREKLVFITKVNRPNIKIISNKTWNILNITGFKYHSKNIKLF